jgi:hypothetical protein
MGSLGSTNSAEAVTRKKWATPVFHGDVLQRGTDSRRLWGDVMSRQVCFFTGSEDDRALRDYIKSLGLRLVPLRVDLDPKLEYEPSRYPGWFISLLPLEDLHPYGPPPQRVNCATDPLIEFRRSYYVPPHLIAGRVYWSSGLQEFRDLTKRHFLKIAAWIRRHWTQRSEDGFYIGPDALRLVREEGAQLAYLPPGVPIEVVQVPTLPTKEQRQADARARREDDRG